MPTAIEEKQVDNPGKQNEQGCEHCACQHRALPQRRSVGGIPIDRMEQQYDEKIQAGRSNLASLKLKTGNLERQYAQN